MKLCGAAWELQDDLNYLYVEVPGSRFSVSGHENGCMCASTCVGRPPDAEYPLRWMWWSTRNDGGFVLYWLTEFGERSSWVNCR